MLGVLDDEMDTAAKKLADAGFERQNWCYTSIVDPATQQDNEIYKRLQAQYQPSYARLDAISLRFQYPDRARCPGRTILLPTSYIHIDTESPSLSSTFAAPSQPSFYVSGNAYFPNAVVLLESMIKVLLQDDESCLDNRWQIELAGWIITYLYGELTLRIDVLDGCQDDEVKMWFNKETKRVTGGLSRIREKWGKDKGTITNDMVKDFQ